MNATVSKNLPAWLQPQGELIPMTQAELHEAPEARARYADLTANSRKKAKRIPAELKAKATGGQTFHLQQTYWTGHMVAGPWRRGPGNATLTEYAPNYDYLPSREYMREVVKPLVAVQAPARATLIVEDCHAWPNNIEIVALLKVSVRLSQPQAERLLEQGLASPSDLIDCNGVPHLLSQLECPEEKIVVLDGVQYLRVTFSIQNYKVPDWFHDAHALKEDFELAKSATMDCIQVAAVQVEPRAGYDGWLGDHRFFRLEIVDAFCGQSTGVEMDYYLAARARYHARRHAFNSGGFETAKTQAEGLRKARKP